MKRVGTGPFPRCNLSLILSEISRKHEKLAIRKNLQGETSIPSHRPPAERPPSLLVPSCLCRCVAGQWPVLGQ